MSPDPALAERRLTEIAALERPAQAKRMLVIVNPYATTMSDRLKHLVVYALQGRYDVTAVETERKGHAIELVAEAAREAYDVVVAFGGDGTVNEAANGIAGSRTPLTCLPGGATNARPFMRPRSTRRGSKSSAMRRMCSVASTTSSGMPSVRQ